MPGDQSAPSSESGTQRSPDRAESTSDSGRLRRSGDPVVEPETSAGPQGSDLARAALERARAAAREKNGGKPPTLRRRRPAVRRRGWSGARPDDRDPQPFGRLASRIAADRGWTGQLSGGLVLGRWAELVGPDIAEHSRAVALDDGVLTVTADSTAWATQLRLLQRQILGRITAGVGPGVVTQLKVRGPAAPSWHHGPRHVRGRGPRDTYG